MKFRELSSYLEKLEATSSRIEITKILADLFSKTSKEEIDKVCYLILGQLAPSYSGIVFNLAERMMLQVIARAFKKDVTEVRKLYKSKGDLGTVAEDMARNLKGNGKGEIEVNDLFERLLELANDDGEGSQDRKIEKMASILSLLDPASVRFVSRMPVGKLRLGFSDKTIMDALSWMESGDKSKKSRIEKSFQATPDIGLVARRVKEFGIDKLPLSKPIVGIPVLPMLAQRLKSPTQMIEKMGKVFVEPKFDGLRILIHFKRGRGSKPDLVKGFTRNLNNVFEMFPELAQIGKHIKADSVILDSEAVGMDPEMIKLVDFQTTMQRRRKYNISEKAKSIPLRFQVFDIVLKDDMSLMDTPYSERREILKKTIADNRLFMVDEAVVTEDPEEINIQYRKRIKEGLEGVVVKKCDSHYVPGRTGWNWVKMKQEEKAEGKLSDTVDCVVMGFFSGRGKRAQFGIGGFLVGIPDGDVIKTVTKIGTGLTDDQFREMYMRLKKLEVSEKPKEYGDVTKIILPDFWVEPSLVVEIAADEITKSPIHSSGYALRFPRLVKFRDDKSFGNSTSLKELKKLFELQRS